MFGLFEDVGNWLSDPLGNRSVDKGMGAQRDYTNQANAKLDEMYKQQRADLDPAYQTGLRAMAGMEDQDFKRDFTQADFQKDPGYDFRMQEGQKALERSAAARGGLQSGGTMKALAQYGQNFASNEYGNAYNRFNADRDRRFGRLSQLAGYGQNAMGQMVGAAGNYGSQYANNLTGLGNAMAGGYMAKGQANQMLTKAAIQGAAAGMSGGGGGGGGSPAAAGGGGGGMGQLSGYNYNQSPSSFFGVGSGR